MLISSFSMIESVALLGTIIAITASASLSGVLMPGPVLAATIAKGYKDKHAGLWIGIGHGIIEVPLIAFIGYSLGVHFKYEPLTVTIGLAGGLMLLYLGINMIKMRADVEEHNEKYMPYPSTIVGMIMTIFNPYWFLWWFTLGAALVLYSIELLGLFGLVVFTIIHVSCDVGWDYFVSYSVNKSTTFWKGRTREVVFIICGAIMIGFGIFFFGSPIYGMLF